MEQIDTISTANQEGGHEHQDGHSVRVTVDGSAHTVNAGHYIVSIFKTKVGVPADYELDQVVHGEFKPLSDDAEVKIKGGEVFVSHVRRGGSS